MYYTIKFVPRTIRLIIDFVGISTDWTSKSTEQESFASRGGTILSGPKVGDEKTVPEPMFSARLRDRAVVTRLKKIVTDRKYNNKI